MANEDTQQTKEALQIYQCRFLGMSLEENEELKQRIVIDIGLAAKN